MAAIVDQGVSSNHESFLKLGGYILGFKQGILFDEGGARCCESGDLADIARADNKFYAAPFEKHPALRGIGGEDDRLHFKLKQLSSQSGGAARGRNSYAKSI